ncbi:solute carrier family 25 member 35-like isoform X2 [Branchiostoma floridae]|uniref:Solute carrier family 25 member 35-like isoform X2 n=1 Tax=Branchiostoma floridae TaxID=7739 RepID=A0A9J7MBB4_BRAFL|nr:solute carrier family 25 member 35-like isoform X2 [Branchiostoma floridae]
MAEFLIGGVSACSATLFSNPLAVVRTRLQLQGELKSRGTYQRHYRNVFHAFFTIGRVDGLLALQKGLVPALWSQFFMSSVRLGTYQSLHNLGLTTDSSGNVVWWRSIMAGAVAGCAGAFVGSPIIMVKTQLQSRSASTIAVGHQHTHASMTHGLKAIYGEYGILGLWRGVSGLMPKVTVGSAAQLSTFAISKEKIQKLGIFPHNSFAVPMLGAMVSSVVVVTFMTPFDVVSTRLYNQPVDARGKGTLYRGLLDCFARIFQKEGIWGLYKGTAASYFCMGPHIILCMLFWDQLRQLYLHTGKLRDSQK